ncbi:hypothetical protein RCH21_003312 [Arthrobacter sp. PL16]|nr:hypothetical protein [Arthrobacter sp. PL16]
MEHRVDVVPATDAELTSAISFYPSCRPTVTLNRNEARQAVERPWPSATS